LLIFEGLSWLLSAIDKEYKTLTRRIQTQVAEQKEQERIEKEEKIKRVEALRRQRELDRQKKEQEEREAAIKKEIVRTSDLLEIHNILLVIVDVRDLLEITL
jgi:hypothetical protein